MVARTDPRKKKRYSDRDNLTLYLCSMECITLTKQKNKAKAIASVV